MISLYCFRFVVINDNVVKEQVKDVLNRNNDYDEMMNKILTSTNVNGREDDCVAEEKNYKERTKFIKKKLTNNEMDKVSFESVIRIQLSRKLKKYFQELTQHATKRHVTP